MLSTEDLQSVYAKSGASISASAAMKGERLEPPRRSASPRWRCLRLDQTRGIYDHRPRPGGALLWRPFPQPEHPRSARGPPDQRDNLPIKIVNFNGVGIGFTPAPVHQDGYVAE